MSRRSCSTGTAFDRAIRLTLLPQLRERAGSAGAGIAEETVLALWHADPEGHYRRFTRGETTHHGQRHARVDQIARALGQDAFTDAEYLTFTESYDEVFIAGCEPFPESREVLESLAAAYPLGAVTNAPRPMQERKLAVHGLADLLPILVTTDTFGVGKPDPRVFREGARLLGADPGRTVYVGDEPDVDAQASARAGLRGVLLRRVTDVRDLSAHEPPADQRLYREVGDLTALRAALALPSEASTL
jgi:putative hydrolase of the HAD superfamily